MKAEIDQLRVALLAQLGMLYAQTPLAQAHARTIRRRRMSTTVEAPRPIATVPAQRVRRRQAARIVVRQPMRPAKGND